MFVYLKKFDRGYMILGQSYLPLIKSIMRSLQLVQKSLFRRELNTIHIILKLSLLDHRHNRMSNHTQAMCKLRANSEGDLYHFFYF